MFVPCKLLCHSCCANSQHQQLHPSSGCLVPCTCLQQPATASAAAVLYVHSCMLASQSSHCSQTNTCYNAQWPYLQLLLQHVQQLICQVVVLVLRHLSMPACRTQRRWS
jgi:hypothetical protein